MTFADRAHRRRLQVLRVGRHSSSDIYEGDLSPKNEPESVEPALTFEQQLFRKLQASSYKKSSVYSHSGSRGLTAPDRNSVLARGNRRIPILRHHTQIPRLQFKSDSLARAGFKMNPLEPTQRPDGRTLNIGKAEIELRNLVAGL